MTHNACVWNHIDVYVCACVFPFLSLLVCVCVHSLCVQLSGMSEVLDDWAGYIMRSDTMTDEETKNIQKLLNQIIYFNPWEYNFASIDAHVCGNSRCKLLTNSWKSSRWKNKDRQSKPNQTNQSTSTTYKWTENQIFFRQHQQPIWNCALTRNLELYYQLSVRMWMCVVEYLACSWMRSLLTHEPADKQWIQGKHVNNKMLNSQFFRYELLTHCM